MTSEAHLLAAIDLDPSDRASRLVYADWLDDQDRSADAQLVRLEEAMRVLPPWTDRYWALKPRRAELRALADPAWLRRLRYGTEYVPVFRDVPEDWKGRWRLVRELTERLYDRPVPDVGGWREMGEAEERRLGRLLPPSVHEWIAFRRDLGNVFDDLHPREARFFELRRVGGGPTPATGAGLVALQVQGGTLATAIRHEYLGNPDPPVESYQIDDGGAGEAAEFARPVAPRLTTWALETVLTGYEGPGGSLRVFVPHVAPLDAQMAAEFPVHAQINHLRVYEGGNLIALVHPETWRRGMRHLQIEACRPVRPEALPAFLGEYTAGEGMIRGAFQDRFWTTNLLSPDDIPF